MLLYMTQLFSYLATAIEERVAERGRPIWRQINTWRHKMFKFSPLLTWSAFAIDNFRYIKIEHGSEA